MRNNPDATVAAFVVMVFAMIAAVIIFTLLLFAGQFGDGRCAQRSAEYERETGHPAPAIPVEEC